jgi:hypothetical protein
VGTASGQLGTVILSLALNQTRALLHDKALLVKSSLSATLSIHCRRLDYGRLSKVLVSATNARPRLIASILSLRALYSAMFMNV